MENELLIASVKRKQRFTGSDGLQTFSGLEAVLVTGIVNQDLIRRYEEINISDLSIQLAMFRRVHTVNKLANAVAALRSMSFDMQKMFGEVEKFVRLLLVCPCSSAEAERS